MSAQNDRSPENAQSARVRASLAEMRVDYSEVAGQHPDEPDLDVAHLEAGWLPLLRIWLDGAVRAGVPEPNAMTLGTVDAAGDPRTRTVLCKGVDDTGVTFYTNYDSDKAHQLDAHPAASVTFAWVSLAHQITLRGPVERVPAEVTERYWATRPRGSQIGAWASWQSHPIASRGELDAQWLAVAQRFAGEQVPVPDFWGGYVVRPVVAEFWQGRGDRMHNRIRAELTDGTWVAQRLQP
ncbi:pyridoxamine 5'-phosphate oxidase [Rhodococcus rhodnii LMG 5362]|uniref:Pyridoxine/pyridoxamine 5'-phosphate oxidase n=2 Tax=Rhodococcus rhodnii TaxID=38312 RepID=R7WR90_9NOCA|nr:pyridoxamine 5'-phosphate oxidase [Rhodococcus rhodnii LMG 5362]